MVGEFALHPNSWISVLQRPFGGSKSIRLTVKNWIWFIIAAATAAIMAIVYYIMSISVESRARNAFSAFEFRDWSRLYASFSSMDVSTKEISEAQFSMMMKFLVDDSVKFTFAPSQVLARNDAKGFRMSMTEFSSLSTNRKMYTQYFGMYFDGQKWSPTLKEAVFNGARLRARSNKEMYTLVRDAMELARVENIVDQTNNIFYNKDRITRELQKSDFKAMNFSMPFRQAGG